MKMRNTLRILSLIVVVAITSCKNDAGTKEEAKELVSGIVLENMDTLARPGDNFMNYVNGTWIKNTEIPS